MGNDGRLTQNSSVFTAAEVEQRRGLTTSGQPGSLEEIGQAAHLTG